MLFRVRFKHSMYAMREGSLFGGRRNVENRVFDHRQHDGR
jgi:hypothetical protein